MNRLNVILRNESRRSITLTFVFILRNKASILVASMDINPVLRIDLVRAQKSLTCMISSKRSPTLENELFPTFNIGKSLVTTYNTTRVKRTEETYCTMPRSPTPFSEISQDRLVWFCANLLIIRTPTSLRRLFCNNSCRMVGKPCH